MRGAILLAMMLAATTAQAQRTPDMTYDPAVLWLESPQSAQPGHSRMRVVTDGSGAVAALTPNQTWAYQQAYRRALARLSFRMPVAAAEAHARAEAFHTILRSNPAVPIRALRVNPLSGPRLFPRW